MMLNNNSKLFGLIILFQLAIIANFCVDNFLPSVPAIALYIGTGISNIQLAFSLTGIGTGVGAFLAGIIITDNSRKKICLLGLIIGLVGQLICLFPQSTLMFISGRLITGVFIGIVLCVVIAVICELYRGTKLAKINAYLMLIIAFVPAVSPFAGGFIQELLGWRYNFILPIMLIVITLIETLFFMPETYQKNKDTNNKSLPSMVAEFFAPIHDTNFMYSAICGILTLGSIFAYLAIGPKLFQVYLKLTPVQYGTVAMIATFALISASLINSKIIERFGFKKVMLNGSYIAIVGVVILLIFYFMNMFNVLVILFPIIVFLFGLDLVHVNTLPLGATLFKGERGNPGALFIFLQAAFSAVLGVIASYIPANNQLYLGLVLLVVNISILCILKILFNRSSKIL